MKKYLLPLIVSMFAFSAATQAQETPAGIEGRVLSETENLKLVQLPNHRQAVYYVKDDGTVRLVGQVGVIRAGTEFYHWGNATPEQAEAWDKAGKISPDLLNRLRADNNFGALGGGFYASLSRVDSIGYGNVQIVLRMPREMKIISDVQPGFVSGTEWIKVINQLEMLGISALQNQSIRTWFNIFSADALTKEHVAKARDWKNGWAKATDKLGIINKFPDIFLEPTMQIEVNRYLMHWKALASSDQRRIYAAFNYFSSIKDLQGIDFSLARIDGQYKDAVLAELMKTYESMAPAERANFLRSENLRLGPLFPDFLKVAQKDTTPEVRIAILQSLQGRQDPEAMKMIKAGTLDADNNVRNVSYNALTGRRDSAALEILKQGVSEPDTYVRSRIFSLIAQFNSQEALEILKKGMMDPELNVRSSIIQSIQNRNDQGALALLKIGIRDSNNYVRQAALAGAIARKGTRSLDIFNAVMSGSDTYMKMEALKLLDGREDAESLKLIMRALQSKEPNLKGPALTALGKRKGNFIDIFVAALKDPNPNIQLAALGALAGKTDQKSLELLIRAANDPSTGVRNMAINSLAGRSEKEAILVVKRAISDPDVQIRHAVLAIVRKLNTADFQDVIKIAMADTEDAVRQKAVTMLQGQTDDFAFEIIKSYSVSDPSQSVRYAAIVQVPNFKTPAAVEFLKDLATNSPDNNVKNYATQQLGLLAAQGISTGSADPATARVPPGHKFNETLSRLKTEIQEAARTPPRCESVFKN